MITAQALLNATKSHAEQLLVNSNLQFKVVNHPVWCVFDLQQQGLVDPDGAPVIARFGPTGEAHHLKMAGV